MTINQSDLRKDMMDEIVNRKMMGDKKFHSETSLQHYDGNEDPDAADPGVQNESVNAFSNLEEVSARRRTMSQPGPVSGGLLTATAARAARRRPPRVMYADSLGRSESNDRQIPKLVIISNKGGDDSGTATPIDTYRLYTTVNDGRGATTPRKRSVTTMDAQSLRSTETHAPPPTNPEDNKRMTAEYLTMILSCMYAIVLVTLGIIVHICDPFLPNVPISAIFSIILNGIGFLYHIFLLIEISRYKSVALKNLKIKNDHEEKITTFFRKQEEEYGNSGDRTPDGYNRQQMMPPAVLIPLKHDYCFSQGRHSGSFYLKMGAAAFAMGHLVHSVLLIAFQVSYILDDNVNNEDCVDIVELVLDAFNPIYCFLQLYFIFKYSNVIILKGQGFARFAFMHMIGSSLCFWVHTIVRETVLALTLYASSRANGDYEDSEDNITTTVSDIDTGSRFLDVDNLYNENCYGSSSIFSIFENVSPYLYPFSVEFNILVVAVYYIIWDNINNCHNDDNGSDITSSLDDNNTICKIPTANEENDFTSNIVIYADCHASNRGLFLGMVVLVIIVGMIIIGFVFSSVGEIEYLEMGYLLSNSTKLGLHIAMLIGVVFAYNQTRKLDINEHPISLLDDILLFICLPAFVMESVFSMVATISILNVVKSIDIVIMLIQVIIQTALLVDGLRRCSNSRKLRRAKLGRELLMFLLITNVAMWLFNTFSSKSPDSLDERYTFYGKVLWSILGHVSLPLIMFYRFHSSVCFADIWDSAYKPGAEH